MYIIRFRFSNLIARILHLPTAHKILFDTPHAHKPTQQVRRPGFIIRPARPRATERLLPNHGTGALAVDVEIASAVAQLLFCEVDGGTVFGEYGTR